MASMAIQSLGAAATFAVGIAIALAQGPEAQGRYGLARTTADVVVALALFGLPQSIVHAMNQGGASPAGLERWSVRYAAVLLVASLVACVVLAVAGTGTGGSVYGPSGLLALLLGAVGWVLHGLQRVLVLCRAPAQSFAWMSILPAVTLLAAVGFMLLADMQHYEAAIGASGVASLLLGAMFVRPLRTRETWSVGGAPRTLQLMRSGSHAFAQAAVMALQPWLTLLLMQRAGAPPDTVGHFVFAMVVYQAFALPASFMAPLLLARTSEAAARGAAYAVRRPMRHAVVGTTAAAGAAALLLPVLISVVFGAPYRPAIDAAVVLALSGPLVVFNRLGVAVLLGRGHFRAAGRHALWRAILLPACTIALLEASPSSVVSLAAIAWWLVEAACALVLWRLLKRSRPALEAAPAR